MNRGHGRQLNFAALMARRPGAWAEIFGSAQYQEIHGIVRFYQTERGVLTVAEIAGLPNLAGACAAPIFAFHIHEGGICAGNAEDPFADAGTHYNPNACPHPFHAGDMPPLFGADGYAFSAFLSNRFTVGEIVGRTVILHARPDDFTTQPSGNSGEKLACGTIVRR